MESDAVSSRYAVTQWRRFLMWPTPRVVLILVITTCAVMYWAGPTISSAIRVASFQTFTIEQDQEEENMELQNETADGMACVFPRINPFDPEIMKLAGLNHTALNCEKHYPELTYLEGNKLIINATKVKLISDSIEVSCKYQEIFKHLEDDNQVSYGEWSRWFRDSIPLGDATEFIRVICYNQTSQQISRSYYALIPKLKRKMKIDILLYKKHQKIVIPKETLNIVMLGFDGVARNQFLRAMNKTYSLLMKDFGSFDFTMHTQVGINTFANLIPLLTGTFESKLRKWWTDSDNTDPIDFIWKNFESAGYRTLYAEDYPYIGTFHCGKIGYMFPPTTYYGHPISVAFDADGDMHRSDKNCLGGRPELYFHFDYIRRLFDVFPDTPKFAFAFITRLTHSYMEKLKEIDDHTYEIYTKLSKDGYLNKTLLITFSDHGPRWGPNRPTYQGMIESRTPYIILTFPKWFLKKYPDVVKNLKTNTGRLTTHYDTHATLMDLLHFKASGEVPVNKGLGTSLFQEIPKNRTCEDAHIPQDFCVCGNKILGSVDVSSTLSRLLAQNIVAAINARGDKELCAELLLDKIIQVLKVNIPFSDLTKTNKYKCSAYKIRLQTYPGHGLYEGTVYHNVTTSKQKSGNILSTFYSNQPEQMYRVGETIDRMNKYKGQADCLTDSSKVPFCYCKNLLKIK